MESKTNKLTIPEELQKRYSQFRVLGAGAMGAVFKAHDANLDKDVAIKLLKQRQIDPETAIRFQQEAKVASKLKHENLVTLMDFGISEKGEPYIIMENCEGHSLSWYLEKRGALSLPAAVNIMAQICDGMEHAHNNGVVHRDLKPSNVIVCDEDLVSAKIKVLDFGIAKLDDTDGGVTRTGAILGTPYYMSPEQFSGGYVDRRADIYAAGCMMFRMLTNCLPFEGDTMLQIMQEKRENIAPRMTDVAIDIEIPEHVEEVVAKCLEIEPDDRYATMSEFRDALFTALEKSNVQIPSSQTGPREVIPRRKAPTKASLALTAFLAIFLTAVGVFSYQEWVKSGKGSSQTKMVRTHDMDHVINAQVKRGKDASLGAFIIDRSQRKASSVSAIYDADLEDLFKRELGSVKSLQIGLYEDLNETHDDRITSEGWATIGKMQLEELSIPYAILTDEDVKNFENLHNLRALDLSKATVTEKTLKIIGRIQTIDSLWLRGLPITSSGVETLAPLKKLKLLALSLTKIDDRALKTISENFPKLESLDLTLCEKVSDEGMRYLAKLPKLKRLVLNHTNVGLDGLKALKPLHIEGLYLEADHKIDDDCMALIAEQWPNLELLNVGETKVTPAGLVHLNTFKAMQSLTLNALSFADKDLQPVSKMKHLTSIHLMTTNITDKTIDYLKDLPNLKVVEAHQCLGITQAGVKMLTERDIKIDNVNEGKDTANEVMTDLLDGGDRPF